MGLRGRKARGTDVQNQSQFYDVHGFGFSAARSRAKSLFCKYPSRAVQYCEAFQGKPGLKANYHYDGYGCGLRQVGVPCEAGIPADDNIK